MSLLIYTVESGIQWYTLEFSFFISCRDDRRWTPLLYVATAGCPSCTKTLVENGAKLNEWDKNRVTRNFFIVKFVLLF